MNRTIQKCPTICDACEKIIFKHKYEMKNNKKHFCNMSCKGKWQSENKVGPNSAHWKGGIYSSTAQRLCGKRYWKIKQEVLDRFNRQCFSCQSTENLHVHHIISKTRSLNELYDKENMMVLCRECHRKLHNIISDIDDNRANSKNPVTGNAVGNLELSSRENLDKCVETIHPSRKA